MANPLPASFLNFPIVDPQTGRPTVDFTRWLNQVISQLANLTLDGNLNAGTGQQINPATLAKQISNLDSNGIVMPNGIDLSRSYVNKYLDYINDGVNGGRFANRWFFLSAGGSTQWYKLGTWVAGNYGDVLRLDYAGGAGFNTNSVQQAYAEIVVRSGNDTAAPNLSGISWYENGGTQPIIAVKAAATGGSTAANNRSWDIYVELAAFANGHFEAILTPNSTFTFSGASASDPGGASSTVVVGTGGSILAAGGTGLDAVFDGGTYLRMPGSNMDSNRRGLIDFTQTGHIGKILDNIGDGTSYKRLSVTTSLENMLQDPGFENTPVGATPSSWTSGTITTPGQSGASSDHTLETPSVSNYGAVRSIQFGCQPGETYIFQGYVKSVNGTGSWYSYFESWETDHATQINNTGAQISGVSTTSWVPFSQTYTIPAGAYYFDVAIANASSTADQVLIDNVSLRKVRSLDSEVADGANYARTLGYGLYRGNLCYRTSRAAILSLSPTHYWPLDNGNGLDIGSSPSNLTGVGTIGPGGFSLSPGDPIVGTFTNNHVQNSALYASATNATTWSIMAWVAPGFNYAWGTTSGIIGRSNAAPFGTPTNCEPHLYVDSSGYVYAGIWNGSATTIKSSYAPNWNIPHHLAVTCGSGTLTLYIDGLVAAQASGLAADSTGSENTWTVGAVYASSSWPSPLGSGWNLSSNGTNFQDVAVWEGTALNQSQIQNIVVSGGGRFASLSSVLDDSGRRARTGAHSTYRPLSNPLTATDAGSNVTITISSFTMRIGGTDISVSGSTITGLGYNTLYYIYYDDPNMAGGAVTFVATTSKETALAGDGRFFVGSILTPPSGGNATIGNSDGGAGAQVGFLERYWPTADYSSGTAYTNGGLAYDQNTTTYASSTVSGSGSTSETWSGFPQSGRATFATSVTLKIISSVTVSSGSPTVALQYSTNNGSTFNTIYNVTSSRAKTLDTVNLTLPVVTQNLQVQAYILGSGSSSATHNIYEIWIEVNS